MILGIALLDLFALIVIFGFGIWSAAYEQTAGVITTFVLLVLAAIFLFDVNLYAIHPVIYVTVFLGYFLIGGIYAMVFSWPNYIRRNSDRLVEMKKEYETAVAKNLDWVKGRLSFKDSAEYKRKFTAVEQKSRIMGYICGWFWDMLWKTLRNPIKWSYETVYNLFARGYESVANKTVDKIIGDK